MKLVTVSTAILLLAAFQANAENYWIPAEKFEDHTNSALEGSIVEDPNFGNKKTLILEDDAQVRIIIGVDQDLKDFVTVNPDFKVCAFVANAEGGQTNTVRSKHNDPTKSQDHVLENERYRMVCSQIAPINYGNLLSSGVKVLSSSQGSVKVRGISIRPASVEENSDSPSLADYDLSRALGYLWGDGAITNDGEALRFRRNDFSVPTHFGLVAEAAFGDALKIVNNGNLYKLQLEDQRPQEFLAEGPGFIPDPRAFLTSVIESEGAVLSGRITDDPNPDRCAFLKALVDDLNPQCATITCTYNNCTVPNCAFIANGKKRGQPARPGGFCGVYLSGTASDWAEMLNTDAYHFVKCDRTPGGVCTQHPKESRPIRE